MTTTASSLAATLLSAFAVFVSTNVDDIVILSVFFADPKKIPPRAVVVGQFLGIALLVLTSAIAGMAAVAVPDGYPALLGVVPLALGVYKGVDLFRSRRPRRSSSRPDDVKAPAPPSTTGQRSQILAVAGVTLANGGDNLAVYIPLFAADRSFVTIGIYSAVFAVLTGVWCLLGYVLVNNPLFGAKLQRYGHRLLPFVLVALGLHILAGARVLF